MDYLDRLISSLEQYAHLGNRTLPNGTKLIGHVPHVAPEAYLHILFAPLNERDVRQLELRLPCAIPHAVATFLMRTNGLYLFSGSLSIDGLRFSNVRSGAVRQPFSILTPNIDERPRSSKASYLFIGGYGCDGSLLYCDTGSPTVYRCSSRSARPLNEWPSFEEMIESEFNRLATHFDSKGQRINPLRPTTPE